MKDLGWRKLGAWALIYVFVVVASLGFKYTIPTENGELIKWCTLFFFSANALEHFAGKMSVNLGPPK